MHTLLQVQPDSAAYATVLAALLEGGQLQASFSVMSDMRGQGRPVDDGAAITWWPSCCQATSWMQHFMSYR